MNRKPSPFQMTLDDLLRRHPDARRVRFTVTGRPVALLPGGASDPEPPAVKAAAA
jgi:hypothetical protein